MATLANYYHRTYLWLQRDHVRTRIYPLWLIVIYVAWFGHMFIGNNWGLFKEYWEMSLTMTFGSFVAGATAEGGAAVAFPVFTKALHINAEDARTFGLMIQSLGMTSAAVVIFTQRIRVLPQVILWVTFGGVFGQVLGTLVFVMPDPYPRLLFTFVAAVFGVAMIISRWVIQWEPRHRIKNWSNLSVYQFAFLGVAGGIFAAQTGSGIDMLTFIVLTLAFGINEKISTPTTVVIMAFNSIVGFVLHGAVKQDIGIVWDYWLVAVPIVILGAPFGAMVSSRLKRDQIIYFLLTLITLEVVTTVWLVPMRLEHIAVSLVAVTLCGAWFWSLLNYRHHTIAPIRETQTFHAIRVAVLGQEDSDTSG